MRIFLSHSHLDLSIAAALDELLTELFGDSVQVAYSSDQSAGGGIPPGDQWLQWIRNRIEESDKTYVILTPNSIMKPWVLWESGAAAGVALASNKPSLVVPITMGINDDEVPSPFHGSQVVHGDSAEAGGIHRLLQAVNEGLGRPLSVTAFRSTTGDCLPAFFSKVDDAVKQSAPSNTILSSAPHSFSTTRLVGHWVTCYEFQSGDITRCHADIATVTALSDRRLRATNHQPLPRTEGHRQPFCNEIEAELASRHLIGQWKNVSDTRYFGAIHLAVLSDDHIMEGYYTSLTSDVTVESGEWKWVRIDPSTITKVDLSLRNLRPPSEIGHLVAGHQRHDGPLPLDAVTKPRG